MCNRNAVSAIHNYVTAPPQVHYSGRSPTLNPHKTAMRSGGGCGDVNNNLIYTGGIPKHPPTITPHPVAVRRFCVQSTVGFRGDHSTVYILTVYTAHIIIVYSAIISCLYVHSTANRTATPPTAVQTPAGRPPVRFVPPTAP
jgi:hypothetical protein